MPKVKPLARPDPRETDIRRKIGAIRGELNVSQGELARRAGIPPSTLSMYMQPGCVGNMRLKDLWALEDVLKTHQMFGI